MKGNIESNWKMGEPEGRTMRSKVSSLAGVLGLIFVLLAGARASDGGSPETAAIKCKKTENVGKCGTDRDETPINCGGATCYLQSIRFVNILNCIVSLDAGLKECAAGQCKQTTIDRQCTDNVCRVTATKNEDQIPISFATGAPCGDTATQPIDDPPANR